MFACALALASSSQLKKAKEAAIAKALTALVNKMKALDAKPKGGGLIDSLKKRLLAGVHLSVDIKSVHFRMERDEGTGPGGAWSRALLALPCVTTQLWPPSRVPSHHRPCNALLSVPCPLRAVPCVPR